MASASAAVASLKALPECSSRMCALHVLAPTLLTGGGRGSSEPVGYSGQDITTHRNRIDSQSTMFAVSCERRKLQVAWLRTLPFGNLGNRARTVPGNPP